MPSRGKRKRGRIRKRSDAFGSVNHFRKSTKMVDGIQGHSGAEKNSGAMTGGFCVSGIKKYPSEGIRHLEGGQLFR